MRLHFMYYWSHLSNDFPSLIFEQSEIVKRKIKIDIQYLLYFLFNLIL